MYSACNVQHFLPIESKTVLLLSYLPFLEISSFRIFWSVKSAPRQLAAFVRSPPPPAVLPGPLNALAAPAMHSSLQDTLRYFKYQIYQSTLTEYGRSAGGLFILFGFHMFPFHDMSKLCMLKGPTANPIMVLTIWRPGQLAGWLYKERHRHMFIDKSAT